jgi:Lon protease-like protein
MMPKLPESLPDAHAEIDRLVALLHRQQREIARNKRMVELLRRVPADLAERVGPELILAMAEREGQKAAQEEAARQRRELPQLMAEMMRRAEAKHRQAGSGAPSAEQR